MPTSKASDYAMPLGRHEIITKDALLWNKRTQYLIENVVLTEENCWEWQRARQNGGRGKNHGVWLSTSAHRRAWELLRGEIPLGLCVLHLCDNPPCVNPNHLFLGTIADNNRDMREKGRGKSFGGKRPDNSGEKNGMSKLNEESVDYIRELYSTTAFTQKELGTLLDIPRTTINQVVKGGRWNRPRLSTVYPHGQYANRAKRNA